MSPGQEIRQPAERKSRRIAAIDWMRGFVMLLRVAACGAEDTIVKYPMMPWLAMMVPGWVFGRHMNAHAAGHARTRPAAVTLTAGLAASGTYLIVCVFKGYGSTFLSRGDDPWRQSRHEGTYPPSLSFAVLYPACPWFQTVKAAHPDSFLRYF